MASANAILVRCNASSLRSKALQLIKTVEQVKRHSIRAHHSWHVLTMYDAQQSRNQVVATCASSWRKVYDTIIPRNVRVSEAPSYGKPVLSTI